ncbi:hypothetical protein M9H77_17205 [Catharanthus roseus]|uniref:Uncharacterized protein n=1 Tax=Catharanthus roseus TaxID=4058 RepID=A0ACC0B3X6_CATRO|nr:hypothetical protein M9H77_17205 [Catharanthus roseus]
MNCEIGSGALSDILLISCNRLVDHRVQKGITARSSVTFISGWTSVMCIMSKIPQLCQVSPNSSAILNNHCMAYYILASYEQFGTRQFVTGSIFDVFVHDQVGTDLARFPSLVWIRTRVSILGGVKEQDIGS